jgi:hypothetical protein
MIKHLRHEICIAAGKGGFRAADKRLYAKTARPICGSAKGA